MLSSSKKKIWRGLVDYANAHDLDSNAEVLDGLAQTLFESMPWMSRTAVFDDVPAMIALRANPELLYRKARGEQIWLLRMTEKELAIEFQKQASEYQPLVRRLLGCLSDRNQKKAYAFAFLYEHMKHVEFQVADLSLAPEDEQFRHFEPGGKLKYDLPYRRLSYKDLADVICDFIQNEHEPGKDAPIRICKRPGCGKLVTRFKKREYCRIALCDRERQRRDDDLKQKKNRDNVFLCRLRKMLPAIRRRKARDSVDRLRQIASDWQDKNPSLTKHALNLLKEG